MTAIQVIKQLKTLPREEQLKVFAYVDAEIEKHGEELDREALTEARHDSRPSVAWSEVKTRLGLK